MIPVENERGERLVSIKEIGEPAAELTFSLVIAQHSSGFLLVRNARRNVWELPGGFIDARESAGQCAARELKEESGQEAARLRWRAVLEIETPYGVATRTSYGALYCAEIETILPFSINSETDAIGFWAADKLPAGVSGIDRALLARYA